MAKRRHKRGINLPRLILIVLIIFAVTSNPSKDDFYEWASNKNLDESGSVVEGALTNLFMSPMLKTVTVRKDFILFSTFTVEVGEHKSVYLGVFNRFLELNTD